MTKRDAKGVVGATTKPITKRSKKAGLPPGTLVAVGHAKTDKAEIAVAAYDEQLIFEGTPATIEEAFAFQGKARNLWINIDGLHDIEMIQKIGEKFGIHSLALEDTINPEQRPKKEDYDSFIFLVLKALSFDKKTQTVLTEQVSLMIGENFLLSFQEKPGDIFEAVRQRMRNGTGKLRGARTDYLAYTLIDSVVDGYFAVLENMGERIEELEAKVVEEPVPSDLRNLYQLKRSGLFLRRAIWPLREVLSSLERHESHLMDKSTSYFVRDVYDHAVQVMDTLETYREMLSGLLDLYLSSTSNRMNSVMKVLTVFAALFMPLTFIAGLYGMNFQYMPELHWHYGYPAALILMLVVTLGMIFYFRRKDWI